MRSKVNPEIKHNGPPRNHRILYAESARTSALSSSLLPNSASDHEVVRMNPDKPLRILKFGGTSVADASCMQRVIEIIRAASRESHLVVVVSAMSGVTNKLIEAAVLSEGGNREAVARIFSDLRKRHDAAVTALIESDSQRTRIGQQMQELFHEGERLCEGTLLLHELTPRARDAISSLGERLSAPLLAAVLDESGLPSQCVEATELVVTDSYYGGAQPWMDLTRERSLARLEPLIRQGVVPVVTGFIGATEDGILTTLGRGGSDYSATILGAALDADEVIIWTDVDGLLTADPRLVPDACLISEISYREAAELAYFGAKVLHPKTLHPVMQRGIPLRLQNTFAPEKSGTRITAAGATKGGGVTALTAISDAALITIGGPGLWGVQDVLGRTFAATTAVRADVLLISQSSSQNDICLVVSAPHAKRTLEALRHEFSRDLPHDNAEHITLDATVAMVAMVGQKVHGLSGIAGRICAALERENLDVIAITHAVSACSISLVIARKDMETTLVVAHREFQLGELASPMFPASSPSSPTWATSRARANAD
ncbi:MAG TPA: aspartate kinase [Terriglobales bacterium]|nr:aspartate kinase [Terriglobales bacterium]